MSLQLAAIDEKSAAIVVRVRTSRLDQHVGILGGTRVGLHGTRGISIAIEWFRICAVWHTKR